MPKRLLQLVLALTLILNGILAPWAMAGMLGGHHGKQHTAPEQHAAVAADAHVHHGHHEHEQVASDHGSSDPVAADHCCDGAICQCGCVLPPALSLAVMELSPPAVVTLRFQWRRNQISPHHQTPLLRPPAA